MSVKDTVSWKARVVVDKFRDPEGLVARILRSGASIEEAVKKHPELFIGNEEHLGNLALNEGLQSLIELICGLSSPTPWNSANARIGVGNSNTAASAVQTGLLGGSTAFAAMDGTYPQRSSQTASWRGTFPDGQAEFAWEEFTVDNGAVGNVNLNRIVTPKGTKGAGETWSMTVQITFS
jgi:hypothetical protein